MVNPVINRGEVSDFSQETEVIIAPIAESPNQWSPPVQDQPAHQPPSTLPLKIAVGGVGVGVLALTAWAWIGQGNNNIAYVQGKLVTRGKPYKVLPQQSGRVARVLVQEGQFVRAGQVLVTLQTDQAVAEVNRHQQRLAEIETEWWQMRELLNQTHLQAKAKLGQSHSNIRAQQMALSQVRQNVNSADALLANLQADAAMQEARLNRLKPLQTEGAISLEQVTQAERGLYDRSQAITESQSNLERSMAEANRLEQALNQQIANVRRVEEEAQQKMAQIQQRMTDLQNRMSESKSLLANAKTKLNQGFFYAPVSGVVSGLAIRGEGDVVQPDQAIAEIMPHGETIGLSSIVPDQAAGSLKAGMKVHVKLANLTQGEGLIPATIISTSDNESHPEFGRGTRVEVELDKNYISYDQLSASVKSEQPIEAEINL